ncbi:hypothetical protein COO60DRAFT_1691825 [Scenedesmus sp. NREL 46B-D3]|nr:hypothetical protein COO60DRAFT_1691825 [Scenedesmus sp. NREL 46B-D3]
MFTQISMQALVLAATQTLFRTCSNTMRALPATAVLLLLATALTLAAPLAAAQKHNGGGGSPQVTQCRFGWIPVTFDREPETQLPLDPKRRPRVLNLRCTEACSSLGLEAVLTNDDDPSLQKPLCYFERRRLLGAPYKIYGSWYAGEEAADYESTCRGRIETGQPTQKMQFGFYCGCSGCTQGCWNSAPGAAPRNPVTQKFNCSAPAPGTLPPYPKANQYWPYYFTGPDFAPNTNPNSTATDACNDPRFGGGANNFPYPICKGQTAAFGEEWGTMDSDFTCKTFNSLVVADPSFFCTTNPGDRTIFPPPAAVGAAT